MQRYLEKTAAALIACTIVLASWAPVVTVPAPGTPAPLAMPELA